MATREELLAHAASKVGTGEHPPGSNCQEFSKSLGRPCEAWCADYVVSQMRAVGIHLPSESAYTPTLYNGFVNAGTDVKDLAHGLEPGDVLLFDFKPPFNSRGIQHVGIFEKYGAPGSVHTIEGNTSSGDGGSQDNGDGVYKRVRPLKFIVGAGRPPYSSAPVAPVTIQGVRPMYDPPLNIANIVADLKAPNGGVWLLDKTGAIFGFGGAPYQGAANGKDYFAGREAAQLEPSGDGYIIVSTSGERYGPQF